MTEDNKRIELTEDNIDYNGMTDNLEINVTADMNITGEDFYNQLKKQILENQRLRELVEERKLVKFLKTIKHDLKEQHNISIGGLDKNIEVFEELLEQAKGEKE